jgi:SAM-dependent methyltransferase
MDLVEYHTIDKPNLRRHPWEQARLQILKFLIKRSEQQQVIVDIGSGDAYLANNVACSLPQSFVVGVDINYTETLLKDLNESKPVNVEYFSNLQLVRPFLVTTCGVVILMDVLEHVAHPENLLQEICQTLPVTSQTQFIVTVPAFQFLFSQHDKKLGHYKRYNRKQLNQLLRSQGFEIQTSGYCFNALLIPRLFLLTAEKLGNKKATIQKGIHNWEGNKFFTAVIKNLFWVEFKLSWFLAQMNIHLPGLTSYSICHYSPSLSRVTTKNKD